MTTTAVPSKLPEDFALNIENLDRLVNDGASTFTNRLGVAKLTAQGAIETLKAFNNRGAWTALAVYAVKDQVLTGGTWYVCVVAHTASAAFATDTASKWRIYQGVVFSDLSAGTGATLVGFDSSAGRTVKQQLDMLYYGIANVTDPKFAGGALDNGTDATAAIQAAIDALPVGGIVHGAGKTFTVTSLLLKSNMTLMNINLLTKAGAVDLVSPVTIDGRTTAKTNIKVLDVSIDGNRLNQTAIGSPGTEDGGRHGIRVVGNVSNLWIERVTANNCASDGIELFSSTARGATDAVFNFFNINLKDVVCNGNRRHGLSGDSISKMRMTNVELNGNGKDLNGTDPLTSGGRGSRAGGLLYGNGFDFEGYGLGSSLNDIRMSNITARGNVRGGGLFVDSLDTRPAGFSARQKVWISDSYFDEGIDASRTGEALTFTSTITSKALAPLYDSIYISNTRLDGYLLARNISNLQIDGEITTSTAANYVLMDYATSVVVAAVPRGSVKTIYAANSTYSLGKEPLAFPANPVLAYSGGIAGTLSGIAYTQLENIRDRTFRFLITASWTAGGAGTPVFSITPPAGSAMVAPPIVQIVSNVTAQAVPCNYSLSAGNFRFSDPGTAALNFQIIVDVKV